MCCTVTLLHYHGTVTIHTCAVAHKPLPHTYAPVPTSTSPRSILRSVFLTAHCLNYIACAALHILCNHIRSTSTYLHTKHTQVWLHVALHNACAALQILHDHIPSTSTSPRSILRSGSMALGTASLHSCKKLLSGRAADVSGATVNDRFLKAHTRALLLVHVG